MLHKNMFAFLLALIVCLPVAVNAQQNFSLEAYTAFLDANRDMPAATLLSSHMPVTDYYAGNEPTTNLDTWAYLDSIWIKYELTDDELDLLAANQFMVSERLSGGMLNIPSAFADIYHKDLPVFISSDAILHALHISYDKILLMLEASFMKENLATALNTMYTAIPDFVSRYSGADSLQAALADADLYICIAKSLMDDAPVTPHIVSSEVFDQVWSAVRREEYCEMPLFCERVRKLDFSQLTPRGHYESVQYIAGNVPLDTYFRAMMWLGRTDFLMTAPEEDPPWHEYDIRRMCYGALLVNELMEMSGADLLLDENNSLTDFMVGESDNLTPAELTGIMQDTGVDNVVDLLEDDVYSQFINALKQSSVGEQKILSSIFMVDPLSPEPMKLPVSYRLMGQRFIIDSYVFSNVVYPRGGDMRFMPDPLDIMFALGNDDAAHLLENELNTYKYAGELAAVRYLVDSYDSDYWTSSLYNTWLGAIRTLNPGPARDGAPYFTLTAAWRQSQLTTQLASWAQLRHDTLLYAKQSYTGGWVCSYPHSYVEPNPEFFRNVGLFASNAIEFFSGFEGEYMNDIVSYFSNLNGRMITLATLAEKELAGEPFSEEETKFLSEMLVLGGQECSPPYSGWYIELLFMTQWFNDMPPTGGPVIADVHTQPTDEYGNMVGKVLHVGTGKINLGVFLASSPSDGYRPMAYVGPVQSYYEKVTTGFLRYTDYEWYDIVCSGQIPRPDWVNCYLADSNGNRRTEGRMLPHIASPLDVAEEESHPVMFETVAAYPNPFNPVTNIKFSVPEPGQVTLSLYTITGQEVTTLVDEHLNAGTHEAVWDADGLASGVYFCRLSTGSGHAVAKLSLLR